MLHFATENTATGEETHVYARWLGWAMQEGRKVSKLVAIAKWCWSCDGTPSRPTEGWGTEVN